MSTCFNIQFILILDRNEIRNNTSKKSNAMKKIIQVDCEFLFAFQTIFTNIGNFIPFYTDICEHDSTITSTDSFFLLAKKTTKTLYRRYAIIISKLLSFILILLNNMH